MDESLKAYAGKRRQEAGAPFELHQTTRQILQGEVARTYKQAARGSWLQRVIVFWPRMAFAAACVAITVMLLLVTLPRQKVMEMAQTAPPAEDTFGRDKRLFDKEESEKLAAFADGPAKPAPSIAPVTPPSSSSLDRLAKNEADESKAKSELMAEARKDSDVRLLREESVAKEVAARRAYANTTAQSSRARYSQQKQDAQLGVRMQTAPQILNNFELEQTGNKVRVIDEDGSIYVGNVISLEDAKKGYYYKLQQNAPAAPRSAGEQQTPFFAFGTNMTLKQEVSIEGNILQTTNVVAISGQVPAQAGAQAQNQRGAAAAQNTILGRARVGTNQEVFINAVPSQP